jgi:hypothetical protein
MKKLALLVLLCACRKHDDATTARVEPSTTSTDTSVIAATAAPMSATITASATPSALSEAEQLAAARERATNAGDSGMTARGNMFGDQIGDSFGAGGLGLTGVGEGGGRGEGIGLGNIGTIGDGGRASANIGASRHSPSMRQGATTVNGRLPPEVIQRIVRQNFARFKSCYMQGWARNPSLQGRVAVKYVIDRAGNVLNAGDGGSDLPDANVVACIIRAFSTLVYPQPEGGIVTVVYPIIFAPPESP